uniref:Putative electron-transferring flavoprotein subunit n=1 Tax=termite gut metagenome TaxID=433724 RepID=S0DDB4_9ZZZZ
MNIQDYKGVYVFIEQVEGKIAGVSYELLGKAKDLSKVRNADVTAVLIGHDIKHLKNHLARYGADKAVILDDPALKSYMTEPYTKAMAGVVSAFKPEIVLFGATAIGRDMAPRVSARVHTGLTADCTGLEIDENGNLMMTRPAFGGNIMATILCPEHRPQMATVRPGVMQRISPIESADCPMEELTIDGLSKSENIEILEIVKKVSEKIDIMDAKILVSGGRGMGCPENFAILEELAEVLGGTISASRAAVDAGWQPKDRQVGQTGKTVRPTLYIACGISGAIQHLAGMEESDTIIAINKDETAPIFGVADFGVVGDALKIVPLFTEAVRQRQSALANA